MTTPALLTRPDGIGASVLRKEDKRLLVGAGCFVADLAFPGQLHAVMLRSSHAHAHIGRIDAASARSMRGVATILTGADMAADGVNPMIPMWAMRNADGTGMAEPKRWALARDTVRHVGEAIAIVVADTTEAAQDAAEAIAVDYEVLPHVVDGPAALAAGAPLLHADAPGNVCFRFERGNAEKTQQAFAAAPHVVSLNLLNNRLVGAALEPRAVIALPGVGTERLTLYSTTQIPHHVRRGVADQLGLPQTGIRVIAPDVGGGFGYKGKHYPEEAVVAWVARKLGKPVKWVASRAESFLSDLQARDHHTTAKLAFDNDGRFLALQVETIASLGAYVSMFGAGIPSAIYSALLAGVYTTPAIHTRSIGVFTNTAPTDAYRGAGRPEACYVLERLADEAALKLGLDRAEIRRRNLIPPEAMPYQTPIGPQYDTGNFPKMLARALEVSDYAGFPARSGRLPAGESSRASQKRRGIGIACFVESSGVAPSRFATQLGSRVGFFDAASIRVQPDGSVQAMLGTHNHGQGHATTYAQILASRLGVPIARIEIVEGDTDGVPFGSGTFGSRSIAVAGSALDRAAMKIVAKGKQIAAHLLETSVADIGFSNGQFEVAGTDRRVSLERVAHVAHVPGNLPMEIELGLNETAFYDPPNFAWSNGVHVCEVEVDTDTGVVKVLQYTSIDDVGTVINPMIVEAQVLGGLAQGLGQVLTERTVYDRDSGQLLSGSFMDYCIPRADDMPPFVSELDETQPCTHNPLGSKGCGEAGSIGAPASVVGAVLDALRPLGVTDLEMPLTPARVWAAIERARRNP